MAAARGKQLAASSRELPQAAAAACLGGAPGCQRGLAEQTCTAEGQAQSPRSQLVAAPACRAAGAALGVAVAAHASAVHRQRRHCWELRQLWEWLLHCLWQTAAGASWRRHRLLLPKGVHAASGLPGWRPCRRHFVHRRPSEALLPLGWVCRVEREQMCLRAPRSAQREQSKNWVGGWVVRHTAGEQAVDCALVEDLSSGLCHSAEHGLIRTL